MSNRHSKPMIWPSLKIANKPEPLTDLRSNELPPIRIAERSLKESLPHPLRPYHSNVNINVGQKNWSYARQLFGYDRLGLNAMVRPMNDLYANNSACPQFILLSAEACLRAATTGNGQKHSKPHPAQRLIDHLPQGIGDELVRTHRSTLHGSEGDRT